jgi:hypothetical protein
VAAEEEVAAATEAVVDRCADLEMNRAKRSYDAMGDRSPDPLTSRAHGTGAPAEGGTAAPPAPKAGNAALAAIASSALALPGLGSSAHAASPAEETSASYAFSFYKEDNLSPSKFDDSQAFSSRERYEIFAHQFGVLTPVTSRIDVAMDLVYETMSGASPWWVVPDPDGGGFLQVMSGATIEETRVDGQLTANHYFDRGRISLSGGVSSEKDYLSGNFGFSFERSYNDQNTSAALAMSFSWDEITPTDWNTIHNRLPFYEKSGFALDFSISQVLYRNAVLLAGLAYKKSDGFLSDPYKLVQVANGVTAPDTRPDERNQLTIFVRYRQHIPAIDASIHFDAAFHRDDWELNSLALEFAWYQHLFEYFSLVPNVRYYSQSQASFYGPVFQFTNPVFKTSDYRLSPYGAISYGLRAEAALPEWPAPGVSMSFSLGYERYLSDGRFALQTVRAPNPGLVDYHLFTVQLGGRF